MQEDQHTEFKESWHDEYARYISAFCNTNGGTLYICINDEGDVVGIDNPQKLIEKLSNFIAQKTGIMPLISLSEKEGKEFISIEVQPSAMPISVHARYYTRSGSVTSELQGNQLNMFLAAKMGLSWGRGTQRIIEQCVSEQLSDTEKKVYSLLQEERQIRQKDLVDQLKLTEQYIRKIIRRLKNKGLVQRIGSDKNGHWQVIENK